MQADNPFGGPLLWQDQTSSTMDDAQAWWDLCLSRGQAEKAYGAILGAELQTRGRGRLPDRAWTAPAGLGLTFTLILPPARDFPQSLILAAGLCSFLESLDLEARIKWPNDVLVQDQKIAGILVLGSGLTAMTAHSPGQTRPSAQLCGIGLNVAQTSFEASALRRPATSLTLLGITQKRQEVFQSLLGFLHQTSNLPASQIHSQVQDHLWHHRQDFTVRDPMGLNPDRSGIIQGLAPDGALLLQTPAGLETIYSGE